MGETAHLKLKTISTTDDMPVKDFFQNLAGDVATSNMQKIDKAVFGNIPKTDKDVAGGVATLDDTRHINKDRIPALDYLEKNVYDTDGSIATAGGIAAWIEATYENAEVTRY